MPTQPTLHPSVIPTTPSLQPSNIPSINPTAEPTIVPSIVPTQSPINSVMIDVTTATTQGTTVETYSTDLTITIVSSVYNATHINSDSKLQNGIVNGLIDASVTVRFDLTDDNEIECKIISVENSDNGNQRRRRLLGNGNNTVYSTDVELLVSFYEETLQVNWETDIDNVISLLSDNIVSEWNITDDDSNDGNVLTIESYSFVNNNNDNLGDDDDNGNDEILDKLDFFYNIILISLAFVFGVIAIVGTIDAWYIRVNDTFGWSTIVIAAFYTFDLISGMPSARSN